MRKSSIHNINCAPKCTQRAVSDGHLAVVVGAGLQSLLAGAESASEVSGNAGGGSV